MMKCLTMATAALVSAFAVATPVMAGEIFAANLFGSEEVPSISTVGRGFFLGTLSDDGTRLDYTIVYLNLESPISQSHIHIGQKGVGGNIVLYLCATTQTPAGVPLPPQCQTGTSGSVSGSLTAANVFPQATQGIAAGEFAEVIRAIRGGIAYANVHTSTFTGGEIRGQIH